MTLRHLFLASLLFASAAHAQLAPSVSTAPRSGELERIGGLPAVRADAPGPDHGARTSAQPNEAELLSHKHYKASNGREVHSPARPTQGQVPTGASAQCRDGSYSFSQHRRGTCSHHGGVASWL